MQVHLGLSIGIVQCSERPMAVSFTGMMYRTSHYSRVTLVARTSLLSSINVLHSGSISSECLVCSTSSGLVVRRLLDSAASLRRIHPIITGNFDLSLTYSRLRDFEWNSS